MDLNVWYDFDEDMIGHEVYRRWIPGADDDAHQDKEKKEKIRREIIREQNEMLLLQETTGRQAPHGFKFMLKEAVHEDVANRNQADRTAAPSALPSRTSEAQRDALAKSP